jgi:hypothetical protein
MQKKIDTLPSSQESPVNMARHPRDMWQATQMRGCFCEFKENGKTRFIEISSIKYDEEAVLRLEKMNCLSESVLGEYIGLAGKITNESPPPLFLYKLQTYLGDASIKDMWDFNDAISDYAQYGFSDFKDLMHFCHNIWGITVFDFVPIEETHIPH